MPFTSNHASMELFCAKLFALAKPTPLQCVLRDALRQLCLEPHVFDRCISQDTPFFSEFFRTLQVAHATDDHCYSLLECLTIFCREKFLSCHSSALSDEEHSLLNHYEHISPKEDPHCRTLMGQWYWKKLPERHLDAALKSAQTSATLTATPQE